MQSTDIFSSFIWLLYSFSQTALKNLRDEEQQQQKLTYTVDRDAHDEKVRRRYTYGISWINYCIFSLRASETRRMLVGSGDPLRSKGRIHLERLRQQVTSHISLLILWLRLLQPFMLTTKIRLFLILFLQQLLLLFCCCCFFCYCCCCYYCCYYC